MYNWSSHTYGAGMLKNKATLWEYVLNGCRVICLVTGEKWKQNTYIVFHLATSNTIIIDPGDNPELIIQIIEDAGGKVTRILITHPHHDHVGAVSSLTEYFNIICELHRQDVRLLIHAPMYALRFANQTIAPVTRFVTFEEELIHTLEPEVRLIHTPGHTRGSVCYIINNLVFTGDTLLYKHIGRTDLPGGNSEDITSSIDNIFKEVTGDSILFPGHGKSWSADEAKQWWHEFRGKPLVHTSFNDELS